MSCTIPRPDPQALFDHLRNMFSSTVLGGGKVIPESNEWYVITNDYAAAEQYYAIADQMWRETNPETACCENLYKMAARNGMFPAPASTAQGYAKLKLKEPEFAKAYLSKVKKVAETSKQEFRSHPAAKLIGILAGILEGEIVRTEGDLPGAIALFETAVKLDDELEYDEPEPLPFPARHWLGAALLEAKKPADAEAVYRADLKDHPHNGWSLLGLQTALKDQGKSSPEVDADLKASWARSDTWIRASRF